MQLLKQLKANSITRTIPAIVVSGLLQQLHTLGAEVELCILGPPRPRSQRNMSCHDFHLGASPVRSIIAALVANKIFFPQVGVGVKRLRLRSVFSAVCLLVTFGAGLLHAQSPIPASNFIKYLPHMVSGGGFVTKLTINNLSSSTAHVVVNYISQGGTLLSSTPYTIAGNGALRIATDESLRSGPASINWAAVGSDQPITVNLFFELQSTVPGPIQSASGFNPAQPLNEARMAVELDPAHGKTFGIALANTDSGANTITLKLMNASGTLVTSTTVPLPGFGQTAFDLANRFAGALPAGDTVGVLLISGTKPFSTAGLGDDGGPFFSVPAMTPHAGTTVLPQMVSGGGYATKITFVNFEQAENDLDVKFYSQAGQLLQDLAVAIPGGGAFRFSTPESARYNNPAQISWALVTSSAPLGMNLFFEFIPTLGGAPGSALGFNDLAVSSDLVIPVEFQQSVGRTLGLALANPSNAALNATLTLRDSNGTILAGPTSLALNPLSQTSFELSTFAPFKAVLPNGAFIGSVEISAPIRFAALGGGDDEGPLFATPGAGPFTVTSVNTTGTQPLFDTVTVQGSGFDPDNAAISVLLTPRTTGAVPIAVPAYQADAGSLTFMVPPLVAPGTGAFVADTVDMQVVQIVGNAVQRSNILPSAFHIAVPLATPAAIKPGALTQAFLASVLRVGQTVGGSAQGGLATALSQMNTDLTTLQQQITAVANGSQSSASLKVSSNAPITINATLIVLLDQVLYGFLQSFKPAGPRIAPLVVTDAVNAASGTCTPNTGDAATDTLVCSMESFYTGMPSQTVDAVFSSSQFDMAYYATFLGAWPSTGLGQTQPEPPAAFQLAWTLMTPLVSAYSTAALPPGLSNSTSIVGNDLLNTANAYGLGVAGVTNSALAVFTGTLQSSNVRNAFMPQGGLGVSGPTGTVQAGSQAMFGLQSSKAGLTPSAPLLTISNTGGSAGLVAISIPTVNVSTLDGVYNGSGIENGNPVATITFSASGGKLCAAAGGGGSVSPTGAMLYTGYNAGSGVFCNASGVLTPNSNPPTFQGQFSCSSGDFGQFTATRQSTTASCP